jgi:SulP family sulfate permease
VHLAIVAQGISFVDIAAADVFAGEAVRRRAAGGGFYLINVKQGLWNSLDECHALDKIDSHNVFQSKSAALHGIFQKLDKSICEHCTVRCFNECADVKFKSGSLQVPRPASESRPEPEMEPDGGIPAGA